MRLIAPSLLPKALLEALGWTPEIATDYEAMRKSDAPKGASFAARLRLEAIQKSNTSAVSGTEEKSFEAKEYEAAKNVIVAYVEKVYPGDFSMQKLAFDSHFKAFQEIKEIRKNGVSGVPNDTVRGIIAKAFEDYPRDYYMIGLAIRYQVKSYIELHQ